VTDFLTALQNISTAAFVLLGVVVTAGWVRRRDASLGFMALAIVLLSLVTLVSKIASLLHLTSTAVADITVIALVGSGYALLRYRGSLIPLSREWHLAAVAVTVAVTVAFIASQVLVAAGTVPRSVETVSALVLILVWAALVTEPIIRFWLVARSLPAVQAWRLRSLSLGFAGIVAILLFAVVAGAFVSKIAVQIAIEFVVIAIVPLLYVSFSPPSWLRREWRASEEEGLRGFMEELLISEDREQLSARALDWAMRLVGGASAATFDSSFRVLDSRGLAPDQIKGLSEALPDLHRGVNRAVVSGSDRTVLMLPIAGLASLGSLVVVSGPFTPGIGGDEMNRVQQFMSAFATALDRRHVIDQLTETNTRLEAADRHKSVFLASMSHELRTPLNAILGFSELLVDDTKGQFPPATRQRFLKQIHSSGEHLLGLINDILDLSKIEAGQMELRLQPVAVEEVVQQVLSTVEPLAAEKHISIVTGDMSAGEITADAGKLKQMLLNLVGNAVKFTPDRGEIRIAAVRLDDTVEISVADDGIGIAPQDQERVFQGFQQVDSSMGRQHAGTGLGLTLTRRFANLHGGDVRVESQLEKGSVFTITLPVEARRTAVATVIQYPSSGKAKPKDARPVVLIVEDDPPAAELLMRQIEKSGFRGEVARTGGEALAKARERRPAAITLDILLPDLDGWEVLTRLKADEETRDIPVIVVSVVDNPELGVALGALDYFVKPVPANDLMSRLARFNFKHSTGGKVTVLVVDDDEANRDWLQQVLEPAGFSVILASGGEEAIKIARSAMPDLVMLDLMMPGVTGFDVVEALRDEESTRGIPIMVLTAKTLTEGDIKQLNGHVSTILRRGSTGASDLLSLLRQVIVSPGVPR
jgi:signal transduction histidine kinase/DNA-binding response OmpR family regulator